MAPTVAPAFTDPGVQMAVIGGEAVRIVLPNTGGTVAGCTAPSGGAVMARLPAGLTVGVARAGAGMTCVISGSLDSEAAVGTYTVGITATNSAGSATVEVSIVVSGQRAPALSSIQAPQPLTVGMSANIAFANAGGAASSCALVGPQGARAPAALVATVVPATGGGAASCAITGALAAALAVPIVLTVTATNAGGMSSATVTVNSMVRGPSLANITLNQRLVTGMGANIVFVNSGGAAATCALAPTSAALPLGLVVERRGDSCAITGVTAEVVAPMARVITVRATNTGGMASDATVPVIVAPPQPELADISGQLLLEQGVEVADPIRFTNSGGAVADTDGCTVPAGGLPTGLLVRRALVAGGSASCEIHGTPSAVAAPATYTIIATNLGGSDMANVTIGVVAAQAMAPALTDISGTQTLVIGFAITPLRFGNSGGAVAPDGCEITTGTLPMGLEASHAPDADPASCEIRGKPEGTAVAASEITITASNSAGSATATVTIATEVATGSNLPPSFSDVTGSTLTVGQSGFIDIPNSGGPVNSDGCALAVGTLPADLSLVAAIPTPGQSSTCRITGAARRPAAGVMLTIVGTGGGGESRANVSFSINPRAPALAGFANARSLPPGKGIEPIVFTNAGGAPTECSVSPALPMGLMVGLATPGGLSCQISGTPMAATATRTYTVTATNAGGRSMADIDIAIVVEAPQIGDIAAEQSLTAGESANIAFENLGGDVGANACVLSAAAGTVPMGLVAERVDAVPASGGSPAVPATCRITGAPASPISGAIELTITATNDGGMDSATVSIRIAVARPALGNITQTIVLTVGQRITGAVLGNGGGAVRVGGCAITSPSVPPAGLMAVDAAPDDGGARSCALTGAPMAVTAGAVTITISGSNASGTSTATVTIVVEMAVPVSPPALQDIAGARSLLAGQAPSPAIAFPNSGGQLNAQDGPIPGCTVWPALPPGLSIAQPAGGGCAISGAPAARRGAARTEYTITATNSVGSDSATVTFIVHPSALAQALGTDLAVEPGGAGGWRIDAAGGRDGGAAVASGEVNKMPERGEEGRSCLVAEAAAPGHYAFEWRSAAGQGALGLGIGEASHSLPDTGEWESVYGELGTTDDGASVRLSWCHPGEAAGARLARLSYIRAPTGLEAAPATATQVNLRWDAYPNATYYIVTRGRSADAAQASEISAPMMQSATSLSDTGLLAGATYHYWVAGCNSQRCSGRSLAATATVGPVDSDADGLIEIGTPSQLHSLRHNLVGSSLKASAQLPGNSEGCPARGCSGYELSADISFDGDSDGASWTRPEGGAPRLDFGDHHHRHFNALEGGWAPIGGCGDDGCATGADNIYFATILDGDGHSITGLATQGSHSGIGMFGAIGAGADIRRLVLVGKLAAHSGRGANATGGLAGYMNAGSITASHTAGSVFGGAGPDDRAGGLVGWQVGGDIAASYTSGDVDGGDGANDYIGGLVGFQENGSITASYASGDASGGPGSIDLAGGLVGRMADGSITASYATGDSDGGIGNGDCAGGLVGLQGGGSITASYAAGSALGGAGGDDYAGGLVGRQSGGEIEFSWGFGAALGAENAGSAGDDDLPEGVRQAWQIDTGNAPAEWDAAATPSLNAWDYGTQAQAPALNYADYDGDSADYHCASEVSEDDPAPAGAALIPGCDAASTLIPGQRAKVSAVRAVVAHPASATGIALSWGQAANAAGYQVYRRIAATSGAPERAGPVTRRLAFADTGLTQGALYSYWVVACSAEGCAAPVGAPQAQAPARVADADSDGLIEIDSLFDLNAVRNSLDGSAYSITPGHSYSLGCPNAGCRGYELSADLSFDANGNGWTWRRLENGSVELDAGDHHDGYFNTSAGGWIPIGDCGADGICSDNPFTMTVYEDADDRPFTAIFEGGGHTITGLVSEHAGGAVGMFAQIDEGASIRRLGLLANRVVYSGFGVGSASGGLVGNLAGGSLVACYTTGEATLRGGLSVKVGGLVGSQDGGRIVASWATGNVSGGGGFQVRSGGLVGIQNGGSITASWASGDVSGASGGSDAVGGLVGNFSVGSISASYATGDASGGPGRLDLVGGFVGASTSGSITASYATGDADAGGDDNDHSGSFAGVTSSGIIADSWGFGTAFGSGGVSGAGTRPANAMQARQLTIGAGDAGTDVPATWNQAAINTLGAWDFGTATQTPALNYADYDGAAVGTAPSYSSGHIFHCDSDSAADPAGAIVIPGCDADPDLIVGQRAPSPVAGVRLSYTAPAVAGQPGTLGLDWEPAANADGYRVFRGSSDDPAAADELTGSSMNPISATQFDDDGAEDGAIHHYWVRACLAGACSGFGRPIRVLARVVDADSDGLIEISTPRQLHNIRHNLSGSSYRDRAGVEGHTIGCPADGCHGYELADDIDFDANGNGWTWRRAGDGSIELDAGDRDPVHFDTEAAGWAPIGDCGTGRGCHSDLPDGVQPFTATFDGGGHTITGLATLGNFAAVGLFGAIGEGADIRRLGLVGNLAAYNSNVAGGVAGGLAGRMDGASVAQCYATGDAVVVSEASMVRAGGLVGFMTSGSITASHASGGAMVQAGGTSYAGGLVGRVETGSITASWASGDASVGAGTFNGIGGLVGYVDDDASITASYASGDASGSAEDSNRAGGLVGSAGPVSIAACYATGDASGGAGASDHVGGLIGETWSVDATITASYATGDASGGAGDKDSVAALVGRFMGTSEASWGFGNATGGERDSHTHAGSAGRPAGATRANLLTSGVSGANTNVPSAWSAAASNTLGAWDFSAAAVPPQVAYADYDGDTVADGTGMPTSGHRFHCANSDTAAPEGAVVIPGCGAAAPRQHPPEPPGLSALLASAGSALISWMPAPGAASYRVWRGSSASLNEATELTSEATTETAYTDDGLGAGAIHHYWTSACQDIEGERCSGLGVPTMLSVRDADIDGDGLIEIFTAGELAMMANDLAGASYKATAESAGFSTGCPVGGCSGYELAADIDFDLDGDGSTWSGGPGSFVLDAGDNAPHFDTSPGGAGWTPVGPGSSAPFTGTFEGNGYTISQLATIAARGVAGLFGALSSAAEVRNLGLVGNLAARFANGPAGGIAAVNRGTITASYATGPAYSAGDAGENHLGGLVGRHWGADGTIVSCFATGYVRSGAGRLGAMGGLAGDVRDGATITASYATGNVIGSDRLGDHAGGLVGRMNAGTITASWASGDINGVSGADDAVAKLVGLKAAGDVIDSWGYGDAVNGDTTPEDSNTDNKSLNGSAGRPSGATTPQMLTTSAAPAANTNVPASWNAAASNTLGAWDLGSSTEPPALNYADYDGATMLGGTGMAESGHGFHCAGEAAGGDASIPVALCQADAPMLIPAQVQLAAPGSFRVSLATLAEARLSWQSARGALARIWRADSADGARTLLAETRANNHTDSAIVMGASHHYWVEACDIGACSRAVGPVIVTVEAVDADGDGLIEIATAAQLDNIRRHLDGSAYGESAGAAVSIGCPAGGCTGYELSADIDFDIDGDGSTWTGAPGTFLLDSGDAAPHFNPTTGGWRPMGSTTAPFTAVFEGNGRTISNLATLATTGAAGMFGHLSATAEVRNLGLVDNLAARLTPGAVGGIAASSQADIIASYTTGPTDALGETGLNQVGGLVGRQVGGAIQSCFTTGNVQSTASKTGAAGGLVGTIESGASITASYATGNVSGSFESEEQIGGLVGLMAGGAIVASWASGNVQGVTGIDDEVAKLIGRKDGGNLTDSWGYGAVSSGDTTPEDSNNNGESLNGSAGRPSGAATPQQLSFGADPAGNTNVPDSWNQAASNTLGAWSFALASRGPLLNYADYDGPSMSDGTGASIGGQAFHCASDSANAPDGAALIGGDCAPPTLIAAQLPSMEPSGLSFSFTAASAGQGPRLRLSWLAISGLGWRVLRNTTDDLGGARAISGAAPLSGSRFTDADVVADGNYHYWVFACLADVCEEPGMPFATTAATADVDGDGLIDIFTTRQLHNIRFNRAGTSYRSEARVEGSVIGCPASGCFGYELSADIDFDADGDGSSWSGAPGSYALDEGDHDPVHFNTDADGWRPVGTSGAPFAAVFEGNGRSISHLATISASGPAGLFSYLSDGAEVRNLGLVDNLAVRHSAGSAGGIAADSGASIIASYATGAVHSSGDGTSRVGGLVGHQFDGSIQACFASGDVSSDAGRHTRVGGLVGRQSDGSITASYATGSVRGMGEARERIGGLVGVMTDGAISASWAFAALGGGGEDAIASLIGLKSGGSVSDSWGFGAVPRGSTVPIDGDAGASSINGSAGRPAGAATPQQLSIATGPAADTDVPASWNEAGSNTLGAWDFGAASQTPALNYADYDGAATPAPPAAPTSGQLFHCASDSAKAPANAALIAGACATPSRIAGQRAPEPVGRIAATGYTAPITGQGGTLALEWLEPGNADGYRVFRGDSDDAAQAVELTGGTAISATRLNDSNAVAGASYHYWVQACSGAECSGFGAPTLIYVLVVDGDGDGLIEIATPQQLHKLRHDLTGSSYRDEADGPASSVGCPVSGCFGYELMGDIDFDLDGDGSTWALDYGSYRLDAGDHNAGHFDTEEGGWRPIGDCGPDGFCENSPDTPGNDSLDNRPFTATFDGGGHAIIGLASLMGENRAIGLFGHIDDGANIHNLRLIRNLAVDAAGAQGALGGLVGHMNGGAVSRCHASGTVAGPGGGSGRLGGLVGAMNGGAIVASSAIGPVYGGGLDSSLRAGGLVGSQAGGAIAASYASGDVDGGGGADFAGGLVGRQDGGSITAAWASGDVDGGGDADRVGGLVGLQGGGSITASYAIGDVDGGGGDADHAGGLVGRQSGGSITASYANSDVDGGGGADSAGKLAGSRVAESTSVAASWGFGFSSGAEVAGFDGSDDRGAIASAYAISLAATMSGLVLASSWNEAASHTLGAWATPVARLPLLRYADYDGAVVIGVDGRPASGHLFHCGDAADSAPDGAVIIPGACATPSAIPGRPLLPLPGLSADPVAADAITLTWDGAGGLADNYAVWRGASEDPSRASRVSPDSFFGEEEDTRTVPSFLDEGLTEGATYHYWLIPCNGSCALPDGTPPHLGVTARRADADGDGLIEISNARELHSIRLDLTGASYIQFSAGASIVANTLGCPMDGCIGYELSADIDFDADGDGSTWGGGPGSYALDAGDHNAAHFDIRAGGWQPLGATTTAPFSGAFEGNGHTISGLASIAASGASGMFGVLSATAEVRNLGLVGNLAVRASAGSVGGLAASSAGDILASYTTGPAYAESNGANAVGGLVGSHTGGSIHACFAAGDANAAAGAAASIGALAGAVANDGAVSASYATGRASGSGADGERVGGLVGLMSGGAVSASWASGDVDGVAGDNDAVAQLIGHKSGGDVSDSWGFGAVLNGDATAEDSNQDSSLNGSANRPAAVAGADELTLDSSSTGTDVPDSWSAATSLRHEIWRFLGAGQAPTLLYADYDDSGGAYHCDGEANAPDGAVIVPHCGEPLAHQPWGAIAGVAAVMGSATAATLSWRPSPRADYYRVLRAAAGAGPAAATALTSGAMTTEASFALESLAAGTVHDYWVLGCASGGGAGVGDDDCSSPQQAFALGGRNADIDGDGLIEIGNAAELAIIANDLAGASYKATASGAGFSDGCPAGGCGGYELIADIDFDIDGDGSTWRREGGLSLDAGDNQPAYLNVLVGGWTPAGGAGSPFTATFDGAGHTITGLASLHVRNLIGMFGLVGAGAEIRRLGLIDNLAAYTGGDDTGIGGLAGRMEGGAVVACHTTGEAFGSTENSGNIGGLVGILADGSIIASSASGAARALGASASDYVGGLVGDQAGGRIIASWAGGRADGGGGASDLVGGLVGFQQDGSITASYAKVRAAAGGGDGDRAGGLVGSQAEEGSITASYATGSARGGGGNSDQAGPLIGLQAVGADLAVSWGFGGVAGSEGSGGVAGSDDRPPGVVAPQSLTLAPQGAAATNAPASWNAAASGSLGAWDFGSPHQTPALRFDDYDGAGSAFHCAGAASAPAAAILIPRCGALLPGQRALAPPPFVNLSAAGDGELRLVWALEPGATHYRVLRGSTAMRDGAEEVSPPGGVIGASFTDGGLEDETAYHYWVLACNAQGCSQAAAGASATTQAVGAAPVIEPIGMPGASALYRYEIGRVHPAARVIRFNKRGGGAITGCAVHDGELPRGMSIDTQDCTISGSPRRRSVGKTAHTVTVTGAMGESSVEIEIETFHLRPPDLGAIASVSYSLADGQAAGFPIGLPNAGGFPEECRALSSGSGTRDDLAYFNLSLNRAADGQGCELSLLDPSLGFAGPNSGGTLLLEAINAVGNSRAELDFSIDSGSAPSGLAVDSDSTDFSLAANVAITPISFSGTGVGLCEVSDANGEPLPAGLVADQASCRISGAPSAAIPRTTYTATLYRGFAAASVDFSISVSDATPALEASASADLFQGSPDGLPVLVAATAGVPTSCTAASSAAAQGSLADHNLFLHATGAGCAIDSIDGQGPAFAPDGRAYTLGYGISAGNTIGSSASASDLSLTISPRLPIVVSSGSGYHCAINTAGRLYCWGESGVWIGVGQRVSKHALGPINLGHSREWRAVSSGGSHNCAITASSQLHCWGDGSNGVLGNGSTEDDDTPQRLAASLDWAKVSAGSFHTCATTTSGQLHCWGTGGNGRLGLGSSVGKDTPQRVGTRSDWASVDAEGQHTCATTTSGQLHCWGAGGNGRLGLGSDDDETTPQRVGTRSDWASVDAGEYHTCATTTSRPAPLLGRWRQRPPWPRQAASAKTPLSASAPAATGPASAPESAIPAPPPHPASSTAGAPTSMASSASQARTRSSLAPPK